MAINRSENMRRIRSKDTLPERIVRQVLRELGFPGYRLHRRDLPGKPDIAYVGKRKVVLINGCFWHGHSCEIGRREPKSNRDYWLPKIERNRQRDARQVAALRELGWTVLIVWECELKDREALAEKLSAFMASALAS